MRRKGTGFLLLGTLLLLASLTLTLYNVWDGRRADAAAEATVEVLQTVIPRYVENHPERFLPEDEDAVPVPETQPQLDMNQFADREMPTTVIDGYRYIGVLDIEDLELSLPVMEEWDYDRLKISPCRFSGSVYRDNLVICAHNYPHHFTPLKSAPLDTEVHFTDMDGNEFRYRIADFEVIGPDDVGGMLSGDWDLTLFTCTTGGQTRLTVRCVRIR